MHYRRDEWSGSNHYVLRRERAVMAGGPNDTLGMSDMPGNPNYGEVFFNGKGQIRIERRLYETVYVIENDEGRMVPEDPGAIDTYLETECPAGDKSELPPD